MKEQDNKPLIIIFLIIIFSLFVLTSVKDGGMMSERDNRYLSRKPAVSVGAVGDSAFYLAVSDFYSDNLFLREELIGLKSMAEYAMGRLENNGVMLGHNGYLISTAEAEGAESAKKSLESLKSLLADRGIPMHTAILPTSADGKRDAMLIDDGRGADYSPIDGYMVHTNADMYYKSDHHLNERGSLYVYKKICTELGCAVRVHDSVPLTHEFLGRGYYSSGIYGYRGESIITARDNSTLLCYVDGELAYNGFIDSDKLSGADKYSALFGGNHSELYITREVKRPLLLVIKDSFALSVCPYLLDDYDILMLDPRYTREPLSHYLDTYDAEGVLVLMSYDTLCTKGAQRYLKISD